MESWLSPEHAPQGSSVYYWAHGLLSEKWQLNSEQRTDELSNEKAVLLAILEATTLQERIQAIGEYHPIDTPNKIDDLLSEILEDPLNAKAPLRAYLIERGFFALHGN